MSRVYSPGLRSLLPFVLLLASCGHSDPDPTAEVPLDDAAVEVAADAAPPSAYSPVAIHVMPDDGAAPLLSAIDGAKTSVHVEVYLLGDEGVMASLLAAKKRGVEVKVILEKDPFGTPSANDPEYAQLNAAGIPTVWANARYALTHAKFAVVDGARLIVATYNFVKSAFTSNREYGAVDDDPLDVAEAEAVFAADLTGADPPATGRLVLSPRDSRDKLRALFSEAKTTLDVEMEEIVDTEMTQRIAAAATRGVKVRVVVPSRAPSDAMAAALTELTKAGVAVKTLSSPTVHAKLIVVDGVHAFVGSENLSLSSLDKNRELGVITDSAAALPRLKTTFEADFAKATPR